MVQSIRSSDDHVLLLDCGGALRDGGKNAQMESELTLEAMHLMGYDAVNLGSRDFAFGTDLLKHAYSALSLPFISSNLANHEGSLHWAKNHIIKDVGGIRVAILGVMPSHALEKVPNPGYVENLKIIPPETAVNDLIARLRREADFIILLSQLGFNATSLLVNTVSGIDLAISSGGSTQGHLGKDGTIPVVQTGSRGDQLGHLQVTLRETGELSIGRGQLIALDESVPADDRMTKIISDTVSEKFLEERRLELEKRRQQMHQELMEGLKLTPEEFFEQERKRQAQGIQGR
jgi:2',3'-cyclic-nucleotide 2'-phosphodiesterase (5'-nucleotidase family)